jgi:4-methylaminobutanoate oxidase (formaldehyde-forming)
MIEGGGAAITNEWLAAGEWTVEIGGRTCQAAVSLRPMYDPDNARIRS